jgi:hypothetical protein
MNTPMNTRTSTLMDPRMNAPMQTLVRASQPAQAHTAPLLRAFVVRDIRDAVFLRCPERAHLLSPQLHEVLDDKRSAWVEASLFYDFMATLHALDGDEVIVELCRYSAWWSNASKLSQALMWQLLKLVRNHPERVFSWLPMLQKRTTRGLGTVRFEERETGCRLVCGIDGPSELITSGHYVAGWRGACLGLLDFLRLPGTVDARVVGETIELDVVWSLHDARAPS